MQEKGGTGRERERQHWPGRGNARLALGTFDEVDTPALPNQAYLTATESSARLWSPAPPLAQSPPAVCCPPPLAAMEPPDSAAALLLSFPRPLPLSFPLRFSAVLPRPLPTTTPLSTVRSIASPASSVSFFGTVFASCRFCNYFALEPTVFEARSAGKPLIRTHHNNLIFGSSDELSRYSLFDASYFEASPVFDSSPLLSTQQRGLTT